MTGPWWMIATGVAASVLSCASFVPQLLKLIRAGDAGGVSRRMYLLSAVGFTLWTIYGIGLGATVLMASNLICLGLVAAILVLRLRRGGSSARKARHQAATP